jgi:hypothetical protein
MPITFIKTEGAVNLSLSVIVDDQANPMWKDSRGSLRVTRLCNDEN